MRMSELFGRTLRSSSVASVSAQAWAERSGLARFHHDGTVWLPLGERIRSRLRSSLVRALPPAEWMRLPPGTETAGWADIVQAEVQSYRQLPVRLAAERVVIGTQADGTGSGDSSSAALQQIEVCSDDPECSRAAGEWRNRIEAWARVLGVDLRGTEHGYDALEVAYDADGPLRLLTCSVCGYSGIE
jgi:hypothetical protein